MSSYRYRQASVSVVLDSMACMLLPLEASTSFYSRGLTLNKEELSIDTST